MKLQVHIACPDCHSMRVVMIQGGWDISRVVHNCEPDPQGPGDPKLRRRTPPGQDAWRIEFNPARGVY